MSHDWSHDCHVTTRYSLALLKPSIRGLGHSNKVSVRMDGRGFVSLQYMIPTDDLVCFVEYLVSYVYNVEYIMYIMHNVCVVV